MQRCQLRRPEHAHEARLSRHTLMRKDHDEHRTERMAMMPALMPKTIKSVWAPLYAKLAQRISTGCCAVRWSISFPLSQDRLPREFWSCDGCSGRER